MRALLIIIALSATTSAWSQSTAPAAADRCLIIVIDGLRPDYVTPTVMPTLAALRDGGFSGENHHAVVPTVTRVNASSIATGSYPRTHGMMGNSLYVPSVRRDRALNTGNVDDLRLLDEAAGGDLLTTPSLGEILTTHGKRLFASSSGSSGSGFLLNHRTGDGALVHTAFVLPDSLEPLVTQLLGPAPAPSLPNLGVVTRAIDALLQVGIDHLQADVMIIWITEPDGSAHFGGVGAPLVMRALEGVDREVARLLAGLETRGLLATTDIFVTSDHGFSTRTGTQSITSLLVEHGLKATETSEDVILAGGAIHVNRGGDERVHAIARLLQETDWIGPVFSRGTEDAATEGWVPGTLSFESVLWNHQRSADLLALGNWTAATNEFGFPGEVTLPGVASHGSSSPYDIRATLIASGPDIKTGVRSSVPTANVDLAPTILALLGLSVPESMDGRVLSEAVHGGPDPSEVPVTTRQYIAETEWTGGRYRVMLQKSFVDDTEYVDFTEVTRN